MSIEEIVKILKEVFEILGYLLIASFFLVGISVAVHHLIERMADYLEWFRDKEFRFRVRTTIVKDIMGEDETQTAKLRHLRVSKRFHELIVDPWPQVVPEDPSQARNADLSYFYSLPGRLGTQEDPAPSVDRKFRLMLEQDEILKPHREYSTLLVYAQAEKIDGFLSPPYFTAAQPVGKECFTYEVHFPPGRRYRRDNSRGEPEKPRIKVYKGIADPKAGVVVDPKLELHYEPYRLQGSWWHLWNKTTNMFRTRYHVVGGWTNFGDPRGKHDWFRVTILKPPQDRNIHICWCMESDQRIWPWCSDNEDELKEV